MALNDLPIDVIKTELARPGLIYPDVANGIQFDVMVGHKDGQELPLCGHNCRSNNGGGTYDCGAAYSLTGGVKKNTLAPVEALERWGENAYHGMKLYMERFFVKHFEPYCADFHVPNRVAQAMREMLQAGGTEMNLFGGDPDSYPEIVRLIRFFRRLGMKVNLTATGRRWLMDRRFVEDIMLNPPNVVAMSIDDMSLAEFRRLAELSFDQVKAEWREVMRKEPEHGQKQKAYEAMCVLTMLYEGNFRPPFVTLLNMVLGTDNIRNVYELTDAVNQRFPGTIVNPYPDQRAFQQIPGAYSVSDVGFFREFCQEAVRKTLAGELFVKRLHYWLALLAILDTRASYEGQRDGIAGHDTWRCFAPGSGRYLQVGRLRQVSADGTIQIHGLKRAVGGHPSCYWPPKIDVVTDPRQIEGPEMVAEYLDGGMTQLAAASANPNCSSLMPRLVFDEPNLATGIRGRDFVPAYLGYRGKFAGF